MSGASESQFILYRTEDGESRIDVRMVNENVWLSLKQMADLFQRDKSTVSRHIHNIFKEGELERSSVVANFATTAADRKNYQVEHFNLDVIISVGYRVKSLRGTQFRIWATRHISDYLVQGFLLDDERYKNEPDNPYFEVLLGRIRDIRSSEKVFWRKVLDIFATSTDYDPKADHSQQFFATVQNKMHWAIHGHTAAEIIHQRADAEKPNMGLTHIPEGQFCPRKNDIAIAKNYLSADELEDLNRIVNLYLEFAELRARNHRPMCMQDWVRKLDQFLQISDRPLLNHAGSISAEEARLKAVIEYEQFRLQQDALPSKVEEDFDRFIQKLPEIQNPNDDANN
ncbi:MAG: virulence RhuM family protein [Verrucomicrobiales bacterium]|nr:virulence RhuM family protein [Verrucomicrobiales bacterium]